MSESTGKKSLVKFSPLTISMMVSIGRERMVRSDASYP
jgi:hypothetical protein